MINSDSSSDDEEVEQQNNNISKNDPQPSLNNATQAASPIPAPKKLSATSIHHKRNSSLDTVSIGSQGSPKILPRLSRFSKGGSKSITTGFSSQISTISQDSTAQNGNYPEDSEHKRRLQLYVFVSRCIAYPFNAKQPTDMARRQSKVTKQNLAAVKDRFQSFLDGKTSIVADEAFRNAVQSYYDTFLCCDRVHKMVNSGGYSGNDFREIFKANIEKRVRILPDIEGLSKETVLSSWMAKFDAIYRGDEDQKRTPGGRLAATAASELILSKEQLYEMFQTILGVKQYEHQILFNACQLDNADEQSAFIRRELHSRQKLLTQLSKENMPRFIHKNMEEIFVEEQKAMIKQLMSIHLEAFPVTKNASDSRSALYKMKRAQNSQISIMDVNEDNDAILNKALSGLSYELKVTVIEASGLKDLPHNRIVFVVMELEGNSEKLSTDQAEAGRPLWETQGDWNTNQPLCLLKLRLMAEHSGMLHLSDDKELAQVSLTPYCGMSENKWYGMVPHKGWNGGEIKLKLSISMDKPSNVKKSGFLYARGLTFWKTWKKRFFMLIQVSQYKFVLCSYRVKKQTPKEVMVVEGYTADFADKNEELEGGRFFFNMVKAGDEVTFAAEEDHDQMNWIYKLYTATGQSYRPALPNKIGGAVAGTDPSIQKVKGDMDRALKHGLGGIVQADPFENNHAADMFSTLQRLTLLHRLNDSYTCLGWFSPGQVFVLDEYCARYGVRGCHRHLCYLTDLLERAENGIMIDPTLLHYSYAFCSSHVVGNRPDGVNTVTVDEKERFDEIKDRLRAYLSNQITHFRYCFPFGRPEGALKSTLTLFERVLSKDTTMPSADPEDCDDVKEAIRACLKKAALVNYTRLSDYAKVTDMFQDTSPKEKLEIILQLAELCIELIQQNEEHHAEALAWYNELMMEHTEIFWSLFAVDMDDALDVQPRDTWDSFALFQMLNNYLRMESPLRGGQFHQHLTRKFAPMVVRYIDLMESSIGRSVHRGFQKETYQPVGHGCAISEETFWKLRSIQAFIQDLHWPDEVFAEHMMNRLKLMAADMTAACIERVLMDLERALAGGVDLYYVIPPKVCVMINVLNSSDDQSTVLCTSEQTGIDEYKYHGNINDIIERAKEKCIQLIVDKLSVCMDDLLKKLSRYDQGTISSKFFNLLGPREEAANDFVRFICQNIDQFHHETNGINDDEFVILLEKALWESMCTPLCQWLIERPEMAVYQYTVLSTIIEKVRSELEREGLTKEDLENANYKAAYSKLQVEEAMLHIESSSSILTPRDNMQVAGYESKIQRRDSDYDSD